MCMRMCMCDVQIAVAVASCRQVDVCRVAGKRGKGKGKEVGQWWKEKVGVAVRRGKIGLQRNVKAKPEKKPPPERMQNDPFKCKLFHPHHLVKKKKNFSFSSSVIR